ncbi:endochitinase-like [Corylus avellana]|uniref:endochitinase-like n=1 Tax=Corylus avellana TaxID=13451 RepID=UPI001E203539|nr:endochitinase-like [Corylus avellana]
MNSHTLIVLSLAFLLGTSAEQCGRQARNGLCPNGLCCSQHGWCGTKPDYCGAGCQSQCRPSTTPSKPTPPPASGPSKPTPTPAGGGVGSLLGLSLFNQLLKHRNDGRCSSRGFYTYDAFITAAQSFGGFGTTGDVSTRKRELAAFLAQTSHETTGGWPEAEDGPYAWGYCFIREKEMKAYCDVAKAPCPPGKLYYGRGPIQLTHNYNYALAGKAIGADLINNPDLIAIDPVISFKTAIWFWMTPQANKPSSHDVIIGRWTPSAEDRSANRVPGYGVITNIINGGIECGHGRDDSVENRIGFYKKYCDIMGLSYGNNLDCNNQKPFAS